MVKNKDKRPERPVVHQHVGMAFHFDSAGWILCTEAQVKQAEAERAAAEEVRQEAEKNRETAEEKREEATRDAIKKVEEALESIDNAQRTYLIDLSGAYQDVALQVVEDLTKGHPVLVYIREQAGGALSAMTRVRNAGDAWILTSGQPEGTTDGGIAQLSQKQYAIDRQTGNIQAGDGDILSSLLTTEAVQDTLDELDEKSGALPISQRQAAGLRKTIEKLDGDVLKKDDILILDGNGVTGKTK